MAKSYGYLSDDAKWEWEVTLYYNNTVKFPKYPGEIAIQTMHSNPVSRDLEIEAANKRSDIDVVVRQLRAPWIKD